MKNRLSAVLAAIFCISIMISPFQGLAYTTNSTLGSSLTGVNWMSGIKDDTYLSDISIPGTHDSGTRIVDNISTTWAKCQSLSIAEQLNIGVRYLDMRLAYDTACKGNIRVVHSSVDCWNGNNGKLTLYEVLNDCYAFLNANPTETIIMSVKEDAGNNAQALADAIWTLIYDNYSKWYLSTSTPQLKNARSKIVLASRISQMGTGLQLTWGDQGSDGGSVEVNSGLEVQDRYNMGTAVKWSNAVKPMLDKEKPAGKWFMNFLSTTGAGISGVVNCSNNMNDAFYLYESVNNKCYGIVIFDYIAEGLAKKVFQCNDLVSKTQANEAEGQYYYRVNVHTSSMVKSFSGVSLRLYYKSNRGSGTESSVLLYRSDSGETNGLQYVCYLGNWDFSGVINGFPTRLVFSYAYPSGNQLTITHKLYVSTSAKNPDFHLLTGTCSKSTDTDSTDIYTVPGEYIPKPTYVHFDNTDIVNMTVPKQGETDITKSFSAYVCDQYGTVWDRNITSYTLSGNYKGISMDGNTLTVNYLAGDNKPTYVDTLVLYVTANYTGNGVSINSGNEKTVMITIPKIEYQFIDDDGTVLETNYAYAGSMPAYSQGYPEKEPDKDAHYMFSNWTNATGLSLANNKYYATYTALPHTFYDKVLEATPNQKGGTMHYCNCGYYEEVDSVGYASDMSTLTAAMNFAKKYDRSAFSADSYETLMAICDRFADAQEGQLSQDSIDAAVTEIMTAINNLVAYLDFSVNGENGSISANQNIVAGSTASLPYGTTVTLTATPNDGYRFDGWYDTNTKRVFSTDATYSFVISSNVDFEARFVETQSSTLTFYNLSGQECCRINKPQRQWLNMTTLDIEMPEVPYSLGRTDGRWDIDENLALMNLSFGMNVDVYPVYGTDNSSALTVPQPDGNTPVANLTFSLDSLNNRGSFVMALGLPDGCEVKDIGIAYRYGLPACFDPVEYNLILSNEEIVSRFNSTSSNGIYILNLDNFTSRYNFAVRGYVTYLDDDNTVRTVYSNQINIKDCLQV
ncbi:MAG: phosphatidylinositol-specific phospholipase C domain-containing protein [Eubacteriales bacterium]|nr:phosphatidylinositol-specific phospholipase C domain-containing protein [Eubacteriales bacterium]